MNDSDQHVIITGGAGFLGSSLCGTLLQKGYYVTVIDDLLYGGESLLAYISNPAFHFVKADVSEPRSVRNALKTNLPPPMGLVHLAAIDGFPACQAVGRQVAWRYNVETVQYAFDQAVELGVGRFLFASTYSNYGTSQKDHPATEESPLNPQSLYAETMAAAEKFLLAQASSQCAPLVFRMAHLYGLSPRPRFDLIVNQFVHDAYRDRELLIYQRGYSRSFLHVQDAVRGFILALEAEESNVKGQVLNLGSASGNMTKDEIVNLILKRLPETNVRYKDLTFGGDMRDFHISFDKIRRVLNFESKFSVEDGVREVLNAIRSGLIENPQDQRYRNAKFIVN